MHSPVTTVVSVSWRYVYKSPENQRKQYHYFIGGYSFILHQLATIATHFSKIWKSVWLEVKPHSIRCSPPHQRGTLLEDNITDRRWFINTDPGQDLEKMVSGQLSHLSVCPSISHLCMFVSLSAASANRHSVDSLLHWRYITWWLCLSIILCIIAWFHSDFTISSCIVQALHLYVASICWFTVLEVHGRHDVIRWF